MKKCPQCGYENTPTMKQLVRLYKKHFGDIPVFEMINRGWLRVDLSTSIPDIERELFRFLEVPDRTGMDELLANAARGDFRVGVNRP